MTYWIVIAMIFVAILAVALATRTPTGSDDDDITDQTEPTEEGRPTDEHS